MEVLITVIVTLAVILTIGYWWRFRSLACPASFSWLLENPYMKAVAGPELVFRRMHLEPGMKLLDVGSGPGRLALPAAKFVGEQGEVVALDIQARMLEKLQSRAKVMGISNLRIIHGAAGSGKTDQHYFDRVLLVTVLGEIPNKQQALQEIFRALKKGGVLSITEVIPDPHYMSRGKVRGLCQEAGFAEMGHYGNWLVFTINFKKPSQ
ncbi:class I SAM-dependent methyltransferase [Kaarinaea lacus]